MRGDRTRLRRCWANVGVVVGVVALVSGMCSSVWAGAASATRSSHATMPIVAKGPCFPSAKKSYTVAMIRWDPSDIFFNAVQLGEQMENNRIESQCHVTIKWRLFGADDVSKQITALQTDLAAGVDGVDLVPWEGAAFTSTVNQLYAKHVPVVVHNADVPGAHETFVAFDNVAAAHLAASRLVGALNKDRGTAWQHESGVFLELRCILGASFDIGRNKGYTSILNPIVSASGGKISIVSEVAGCNDSTARSDTDQVISRYGDKLLGVVAMDGDSGFGAESALASAGMAYKHTDKRYIPVVAVDGSQAELNSIAEGGMLTAGEQPAIAEGIIVERILYEELATKTVVPASSHASTYAMPGFAGAPWLPVKIIRSPDFTGPWYQTQTYDTTSLPLASHLHWANIQDYYLTGKWPVYTSKGCVSGCPTS